MKGAQYLSKHRRANKFDQFVFWTCLIDLLFLPYVWFVAIPYTLPIILYWFYKRVGYFRGQKEYQMFLGLVVIMVFSTLIGIILNPEYSYNNVVLIILFIAMFFYYFMFSDYIKKHNFSLKYVLVAFIIFVDILAILYNVDKALYQVFKTFWNNRAFVTDSKVFFDWYYYRYSFIWFDANNIAYTMNAIVLYLFTNEKTNLFIKIASILSLLFVLYSCQSNGGFIALYSIIILYVTIKLLDLFKKHLTIRINLKDILIFVVTIVFVIYIAAKIPDYLNSDIVTQSNSRIAENSADSRYNKWDKIIEDVTFLEYIIIGRGGIIIVNGSIVSPHNGHLFLILSYGFISYYIFMYIFFRKRRITPIKQYIWIIPFLLGFSANIMIGEIKLMGVIILMLSCSTSQLYLNNIKRGT